MHIVMTRSSVLIIFVATLAACTREEGAISDETARGIADSRYRAHAAALGHPLSAVPTPNIQRRPSDTIYTYLEPESGTEITVIIEPNGKVADTSAPR